MKITSIFAAMPLNHSGLLEVKRVVTDTLTELGITPEDVNLGYSSLPYYDGMTSGYMNTISESIKNGAGIILYASATFGLPGSLLQTFMEHISSPEHRDIMNSKNCFIIMHSNDDNGHIAMSALDLAVYNAGAFTGARLLVDNGFYQDIEEGGKNYVLVEKLCEDYYRALRQQRDIYRPVKTMHKVQKQDSYKAPVISITNPNPNPNLNPAFKPKPQQETRALGESAAFSRPESLNLDKFTEAQQRDIDDLAKLFSGKSTQGDNLQEQGNGGNSNFSVLSLAPAARTKPVPNQPKLVQKTASLMHYYKAGLSDGLKATISLDINGNDAFIGFIKFDGPDADFRMGQAENPDVTIIADDNKWNEIIKGKISAQKAFMIGQIKVRGNFVLLSKFDQLFDFDRNVD
ncbi:MAG: SCP2 sterol-binding domain-containing protein [Defluviitaleaceae bacterium]|nr:SCP2 sterol-binding domain-containing protein [Defluviitaleaceae bacterium]